MEKSRFLASFFVKSPSFKFYNITKPKILNRSCQDLLEQLFRIQLINCTETEPRLFFL